MGNIISHPSTWLTVEGDCHVLGHTWHPSCLYCAFELFTQVYLESYCKVYLPLFVISSILRGKSIRSIIRTSVPSALRSALFLAINAGGFIGFICLIRRLLGRFYKYSTSFFPSLFASLLAILCERKNRRSQLMSYVGAIAIETIYRMLKYRGKVKVIPYGEVAIFALATTTFYTQYKSGKKLDDAVGMIFSVLSNPPGRLSKALWKRSKGVGGVSSTVVPFLLHTAIVCLWGFSIGYGIQTLLSLVQLGQRIIKNPRARIRQALTKPYNRQFGAFFATLTGFFNILNSLLFLLAVPRDVRVMIAGLFAGLSMTFIRSTTISLYTASKALELVFFRLVDQGYLRSYYYGDVILYSFFTAVLFHAALLEAHNLRISYWRFLNRITDGRVAQINYDVVDGFQTDASQLHRMLRAQQQVERQQHHQH